MHSFLCVFPLFEKTGFYQVRQLLDKSSTVAIYRDPWNSFLDRSYLIFDPSSYLEFVSIASRRILDPSIKFLSG